MAAPTITSYTPASGPAVGGTLVTVTGTNLTFVDAVMIGGTACVITSKAAAALTFRAPAHVAGPVTLDLVDETDNVIVPSATPFTYNAVAAPEQLVSTLARKWKMDIDSSPAQDGTGYIPVRAVTDFQPAVADTMQDDSDYESGGWGSDVKTMLKWSLVTKLARKRGVTSLSYDPGQEILRAAQDQFDAAGIVRVRWYNRNGGTESFEGYANVQWAEDGGNTSALGGVTCTLTGVGARMRIPNPTGL